MNGILRTMMGERKREEKVMRKHYGKIGRTQLELASPYIA